MIFKFIWLSEDKSEKILPSHDEKPVTTLKYMTNSANDCPKEIELKNVSYRYEGANHHTLQNINLKINPGEHIAIVGLNGAGKTTLVKLLCGLIDPTEGQIFYDGIDIRKYNRDAFYRLFSAVFQQFSILPVTIGEIVSETTPENIDYDKMKRCLTVAGLWNKIEQLTNGVDSQFGKTIYDDGVVSETISPMVTGRILNC